MDFQKLFDAMAAQDRKTRGNYHLTLGELIEVLSGANQEAKVSCDGSGLGEFDSYRGYYADLSITPSDEVGTVGTLLSGAKAALGETFTGYKGGDFTMGPETPLWFASYGCCGDAIVGIDIGEDTVILERKRVD